MPCIITQTIAATGILGTGTAARPWTILHARPPMPPKTRLLSTWEIVCLRWPNKDGNSQSGGASDVLDLAGSEALSEAELERGVEFKNIQPNMRDTDFPARPVAGTQLIEQEVAEKAEIFC